MTMMKIKEAALRLFAQKGYEAAPLSEIAKEVGIKTPSLYAHFRSKEDLFLAVFEDVLQEHLGRVAALEQLINGMDVHEKLYTILKDSCQTYLLSEDSVTFLKRAMLFPPEPLQRELQGRFPVSENALSAVLRTIFEEGMQQGVIRRMNTDELMASYYCLLDGTFIQKHYYNHNDFERRIQSIWRLYWQGIIVQHHE
ncbi:TetR/AcrR family transcriptional regulator [Paenibacillus sp. 32352]|uniref:TetR/AcrR family transcriptional regulator n=1 Tax=Paenibacillus sp. 32352 TaxID=1969111 RepID=UPI0009AD7D6C|nr:TetR/AcrR family transcriptional regulator [Paenibacillus sp. 32352]